MVPTCHSGTRTSYGITSLPRTSYASWSLLRVPVRALTMMCVLLTDGRVSYQHEGLSIAHVVPEALDGGGLAAIRTADWIYLDLSKGEFQVVAQTNRHRGYKALQPKELTN